MSETFVTDKGKEVSEMSSNRARAFVGVTNGIAEAFHVPRPIVYDGCDFVVNEEEFCSLVEFIFQNTPLNVLFGWAPHAAGIYESIKDELYEWHWREWPSNCSIPPKSSRLEPTNSMEFRPTRESGKKIGPLGS